MSLEDSAGKGSRVSVTEANRLAAAQAANFKRTGPKSRRVKEAQAAVEAADRRLGGLIWKAKEFDR